METFLQKITDSVGTQLQGKNSTIVKMKKEDDRYKQFSERITNVEREVLDMGEKYENRSDEPRGGHVDQNQGKAVIIGFHSETSESEVIQLLKETITEIGMKMRGSNAPQSRSHMQSFTSGTTTKETNTSGQRTC